MGNILKKILLVIITIFGVVGVLIYLLIYSPQLANNTGIIQIRHKYEGKVWQVRKWFSITVNDHCGVMGTPIRVLTGLGDEGGYRYSLQGRLEAIDNKGSTVMLLCSNGKRYTFVVELKPGAEQGKVEILGVSDEGAGRRKNKWVLSTTGNQYDQSYIYDMVWEDSRTLAQILSEYRQDPSEAINKNAENKAEISRY